MFSRVDLRRYHCEQLTFVFHRELSETLAEKVFLRPVGKGAPERPARILYGTIYTRAGQPHIVQGIVIKAPDTYHVEFRYIAQRWPKPPKSIRPASALAEALAPEIKRADVDCLATFAYQKGQGWRPVLDLPLATPAFEAQDMVFTHIESITFGRRTADTDGELEYEVGFSSRPHDVACLRISLSIPNADVRELPLKALKECADFSRRFVRKEGGVVAKDI